LLFANRKKKQFEDMFLPYLDACFNLARYMCGNNYDAEDVVQEVYIRAFRAFSDFNNDNSRAWILTITRNACFSWLRKNNMNQNISLDDDNCHIDLDSMLMSADENQSPEQLLVCKHTQLLVRKSIQLLPINFREILVLRELEELSYEEISVILDLPKGTVMSRLARARKKLQVLILNAQQEANDGM
jgi:RNA polymerase sigma-70 factor (ECF subfamily)